MTHSIALVAYFSFWHPFGNVTDAFPNLSIYTGEWFCYLATFICSYGISIITLNSLLIAVMKYMFIVHNTKVLEFGEDRTKKLFLILDLTIPFIYALITVVTQNIEPYANLLSCFGLKEQALKQYSTWDQMMKTFFLCELNTTDKDKSDQYA